MHKIKVILDSKSTGTNWAPHTKCLSIISIITPFGICVANVATCDVSVLLFSSILLHFHKGMLDSPHMIFDTLINI